MGKYSLVKDEERDFDKKDFRKVDDLVDVEELGASIDTLLDTGSRGAESTRPEQWMPHSPAKSLLFHQERESICLFQVR